MYDLAMQPAVVTRPPLTPSRLTTSQLATGQSETVSKQWIFGASIEQLQQVNLDQVSYPTLVRLAVEVEVEVKSYFDFVDTAQRKAMAEGRACSAHNVFERDRQTGQPRPRHQQLEMARRAATANMAMTATGN